VLAYLFWHRPLDPAAVDAYERAVFAFHRSLARSRPVGMCGSWSFRVPDVPWRAAPGAGEGEPAAASPAYEDWYLVEDFTALGVLNEAAVGHGHRTPHDEAARRSGAGAGGLYALVEGEHPGPLSAARLAVWVARPPGSERRPLGELLGDGIDPRSASLWRRQLVLGPAPEFCLLAGETPAGVAPARLPAGWTATSVERVPIWQG